MSDEKKERKFRSLIFNPNSNLTRKDWNAALEKDLKVLEEYIKRLKSDLSKDDYDELNVVLKSHEKTPRAKHAVYTCRMENRGNTGKEMRKGNLFSMAVQYVGSLIENKDSDVRSLHHNTWKKSFGASAARMNNVKKLAEIFSEYPAMLKSPLDGDLILRCDRKIRDEYLKKEFMKDGGSCYVPGVDLDFYLVSGGFVETKRAKDVDSDWTKLFKHSAKNEYCLDGSIPWQRRLLFGVSQDIQERKQRITTVKNSTENLEEKNGKPIIYPPDSTLRLPISKEPYLKPIEKLAELVKKEDVELSDDERGKIERWAYQIYLRAREDDREDLPV